MIVVDRIEDGIAVIYSGSDRLDVPVSDLPEGVHEGSVLKREDGGYSVDEAAESARRSMVAEKARKLFSKKRTDTD